MSMYEAIAENKKEIKEIKEEMRYMTKWLVGLCVVYLLLLILVGVIIITGIKSFVVKDKPNMIYECEISAWYAGEGHENHYVEEITEYTIDRYSTTINFKFKDGGVGVIHADDINYVCEGELE